MSRPLLCLFVLGAVALGLPAAAFAQNVPTNFSSTPVVTGLGEPTSFAFLPDGRVLLTEQRTGAVRMVVGGHIAATNPVLAVPSLNSSGNERGLLAIAIDPNWPASPYVYLYYSRIGSRMRLVRYEAIGDVSNPTGENLTLVNARLLMDDIPDNASNHNGGALRFGPDDHLYLSIGEDADRCSAQDSTRLKGVLLRLKVSDVPPGAGAQVLRSLITPLDNPLSTPDSNAKLVYAYGFRNPYRFHVDPQTGLVYVADVGEISLEEYDEVRAGDNLGWPFREGTEERAPGGCAEPGGIGASPYRAPIAEYTHSFGAAIMSAGVYRPPVGGTEIWPTEYWGDAFYTDYYTGYMWRIKNTAGSWAPAAPVAGQPSADNWGLGFDSGSDYLVGPDGSMWWVQQFDPTFGSFSGSLNRIRYSGPAVSVPSAETGSLDLAAAPSPFTTSTDLSFTLARGGNVRLAVFDVGGREVTRLMDGAASAGRTRLTWNGTDGSGRSAAAGVYLARLESAEGSRTVRVLKLR
jgi:glucose/arabinose dehydrogenase